MTPDLPQAQMFYLLAKKKKKKTKTKTTLLALLSAHTHSIWRRALASSSFYLSLTHSLTHSLSLSIYLSIYLSLFSACVIFWTSTDIMFHQNHKSPLGRTPLEATLVIFGRRALIFFLFESSWKNMKNDTTFLRMRSGDHLGDAKMSKKGTSLRRI